MQCVLVFWLAICYKHCLTLLRLELLREEHLQIAFSVQLSSLGKRERKDQRTQIEQALSASFQAIVMCPTTQPIRQRGASTTRSQVLQ
jgi:hypothetical protein